MATASCSMSPSAIYCGAATRARSTTSGRWEWLNDRQREALDMARVAAGAAATKLADDVVVIDAPGSWSSPTLRHCFETNERQVNAIVDEVEEKIRQAGSAGRRECPRSRWTLLDYRDIVGARSIRTTAISTLDRLWGDCPVVPVDLSANSAGAQ